jgi:hypothetical protein
LSVGSVVIWTINEKIKEHERQKRAQAIIETFESEDLASSDTFLASRAIGGLNNSPGMTWPAKLHRNKSVSSHQYVGTPTVKKTGVQAQCVSLISATTNAGPFPGVGDLFWIGNEDVVKDFYGVPAIYGGDAATQIKTIRPLDLSKPKQRSVAYVRREHHLPSGVSGERFTDKYSVQQFSTLQELSKHKQSGEHNEVVADLDGRKLAGSYFFMKDPHDDKERQQKEFEIVVQRTMHRLRAGNRVVDQTPVIEIRKEAGSLVMINRDDLATRSLLTSYRNVLGEQMSEDDRRNHLAEMAKRFYVAQTKAKEAPYASPSFGTNIYLDFVMLSCVGKLPLYEISKVRKEVSEFQLEAERQRQARKSDFRLQQTLLKSAALDQSMYESIIEDNSYERVLDFVRKDDGTPYFKLNYAASRAVQQYEIPLDDKVYFIVVAPVGFNQNWRFDGLENRLKPTARTEEVVPKKKTD